MTRDEQEGRDWAQRSVRWLYGAWAAYWATLPVVALGTPAALFLRLRQQAPGRAAFTVTADEGLKLRLTVDGATAWAAGMSYTELALWLAAPPLVLWVAWLWWTGRGLRRAPRRATASSVRSVPAAQPRQLGVAAPPGTFGGAGVRAPEGVRAPVDRTG